VVTLNDEACRGLSLSRGARQSTRVRHVGIISRRVSDRKTRHTLGDLDLVLIRLSDLCAGHEPRWTWRRDAAELRLELTGLPEPHLSRTDIRDTLANAAA